MILVLVFRSAPENLFQNLSRTRLGELLLSIWLERRSQSINHKASGTTSRNWCFLTGEPLMSHRRFIVVSRMFHQFSRDVSSIFQWCFFDRTPLASMRRNIENMDKTLMKRQRVIIVYDVRGRIDQFYLELFKRWWLFDVSSMMVLLRCIDASLMATIINHQC